MEHNKMDFKKMYDNLKEKKNGPLIFWTRFAFYGIGILSVFLGGIKMFTMFVVLVGGFLLGKYSEKVTVIVKDYRLAQKIQKITFTQAEYEGMKKELETLRIVAKNQPRPQTVYPHHSQRPMQPHVQEYPYYQDEQY